MFTGIISDIGEILAVEERAEGLRRVRMACRTETADARIGASIACAGICLTVVATGDTGQQAWFEIDVGAETLAVTRAGAWKAGTQVNLERALKAGDELGGHLVTGHVDGLATLFTRENLTGMARLSFRVPAGLARFIASKGSVALDGVSLTVNTVEGDRFSVLLIPHTLAVTTLRELAVGDQLHIEVDQMARYVARVLERC